MINQLTQTRIILNIHNFFPHMIKMFSLLEFRHPQSHLSHVANSHEQKRPHMSLIRQNVWQKMLFFPRLCSCLCWDVVWDEGLSVVTIRPLLTGPPCPRPVSPGPASIHQVSAIPSPDCLLWLGTPQQTNTKITKNSGKCPNIFKNFSHRIFTAFVSKCQCPLTF